MLGAVLLTFVTFGRRALRLSHAGGHSEQIGAESFIESPCVGHTRGELHCLCIIVDRRRSVQP
jgi:hypothetical protein